MIEATTNNPAFTPLYGVSMRIFSKKAIFKNTPNQIANNRLNTIKEMGFKLIQRNKLAIKWLLQAQPTVT